jgi:MoaA/NifB/PqqE/SkfB family radical SAM enzyme
MHIEPTSRCTLSCPGCPRTWFSDKFNRAFPKQDLNLDHLERFLDCESGHQVQRFTLCGNHGDPIYYPDLLSMIERFRSTKSFDISTNGSYQTPKFWHELSNCVTEQDTIFFSIDGLEHNNHLYRKNSDWKSIMQGLEIMSQSPARVIWKTIIFAYNANELDQIQDMAHSYGVEFASRPTARFGDDSLKPDVQLIDTSVLYKNIPKNIKIQPQCSTLEYISADGYYWPCCLISSMFTLHKTELWKQRKNWTIQNQTLDQTRSQLNHWKQNILDSPETAHDVCKMHCKPGQVNALTDGP